MLHRRHRKSPATKLDKNGFKRGQVTVTKACHQNVGYNDWEHNGIVTRVFMKLPFMICRMERATECHAAMISTSIQLPQIEVMKLVAHFHTNGMNFYTTKSIAYCIRTSNHANPSMLNRFCSILAESYF